MLELANDKDGVLVVFCGDGVFMCFQGVYRRCGGANNLCCIGQSLVKDSGFNSPTSYYCVQTCVVANIISNIKTLCVSVVHILLLVSF